MPPPSGAASPAGPAVPVAFDPLAALEKLDAGLLCVDAQWRILFANRAWNGALRGGMPAPVGEDFWRTYPPFAAAPEAELLRETMRDGETRTFPMVFEMPRRGSFDVRAARYGAGGLLLLLRDNAQQLEAHARGLENEALRRQAETLLEQVQVASQAKSVFLATISHELRTPLTALTGYGELLADEIVGPLSKAQHDVLERMRSVTHHLTAMIDELLAYTRLEGGRELVRSAEVPADELVRTTTAVIEPLARSKGLAVREEIPDPAPALVTDADKVRQILVNLAGNAVKFTDTGSVTLSVCEQGDRVVFEVRDTGSGIPAEDQKRLFQPFTQLDSGLTRRHGGTGLGLYISRRLAALLGGELRCASTVGEGSVFTLIVPRHPTGPEAVRAA